jgi:hypothetical protein
VADTVEFQDATWPLLYVRFPREFSPAVMQATIDAFERIYVRGERFVNLVDCSPIVKFPGMVERKMLSEWMATPGRADKEKAFTVATAIVLRSGPMRAMMSAITWVSPPVSPQVWKATEADAFDWCFERLVEARLPVTKAIEAARAEYRRNRPASQRVR